MIQSFLGVLWRSITDPSIYPEIAFRRKLLKSCVYFVVWLVVFSFLKASIVSSQLVPLGIQLANTMAQDILSDFPQDVELTIENGILRANTDEAFSVDMSAESLNALERVSQERNGLLQLITGFTVDTIGFPYYAHWFRYDPTANPDSIGKIESIALLTNDRLSLITLPSSRFSQQILLTDVYENVSISMQSVEQAANSLKSLGEIPFWFYLLCFWVFEMIATLFDMVFTILLYSLMLYTVGTMISRPYAYRVYVVLCLHIAIAVQLIILLSVITYGAGPQWFESMIFFLISTVALLAMPKLKLVKKS